jgi:WD40 repeat protein
MDVCIPLDILAVGNESGKVFIYSLSSDIQPPKSRVIRKPKKETTNVKKESNADPLRESNAKGRKDIGDNDDNGDDSDSVEGREGEMAPSNGSGKNGKASASTDAKDDVFAQIHERCETQAPRQPHVTLQHPKCMNNVRQVAFDPNGRHVVYCCDDGTVWVWSISVSR